jgi:hypothetical protein
MATDKAGTVYTDLEVETKELRHAIAEVRESAETRKPI